MASKKQAAVYVGVVAACFVAGIVMGFAPSQVNNAAYDFMTAHSPVQPLAPESAVVAIDEATFAARGGPRRLRSILAEALDQIAKAEPKAVALDVTLHDAGDPAEDQRLEASLRATSNLILPSKISGTA